MDVVGHLNATLTPRCSAETDEHCRLGGCTSDGGRLAEDCLDRDVQPAVNEVFDDSLDDASMCEGINELGVTHHEPLASAVPVTRGPDRLQLALQCEGSFPSNDAASSCASRLFWCVSYRLKSGDSEAWTIGKHRKHDETVVLTELLPGTSYVVRARVGVTSGRTLDWRVWGPECLVATTTGQRAASCDTSPAHRQKWGIGTMGATECCITTVFAEGCLDPDNSLGRTESDMAPDTPPLQTSQQPASPPAVGEADMHQGRQASALHAPPVLVRQEEIKHDGQLPFMPHGGQGERPSRFCPSASTSSPACSTASAAPSSLSCGMTSESDGCGTAAPSESGGGGTAAASESGGGGTAVGSDDEESDLAAADGSSTDCVLVLQACQPKRARTDAAEPPAAEPLPNEAVAHGEPEVTVTLSLCSGQDGEAVSVSLHAASDVPPVQDNASAFSAASLVPAPPMLSADCGVPSATALVVAAAEEHSAVCVGAAGAEVAPAPAAAEDSAAAAADDNTALSAAVVAVDIPTAAEFTPAAAEDSEAAAVDDDIASSAAVVAGDVPAAAKVTPAATAVAEGIDKSAAAAAAAEGIETAAADNAASSVVVAEGIPAPADVTSAATAAEGASQATAAHYAALSAAIVAEGVQAAATVGVSAATAAECDATAAAFVPPAVDVDNADVGLSLRPRSCATMPEAFAVRLADPWRRSAAQPPAPPPPAEVVPASGPAHFPTAPAPHPSPPSVSAADSRPTPFAPSYVDTLRSSLIVKVHADETDGQTVSEGNLNGLTVDSATSLSVDDRSAFAALVAAGAGQRVSSWADDVVTSPRKGPADLAEAVQLQQPTAASPVLSSSGTGGSAAAVAPAAKPKSLRPTQLVDLRAFRGTPGGWHLPPPLPPPPVTSVAPVVAVAPVAPGNTLSAAEATAVVLPSSGRGLQVLQELQESRQTAWLVGSGASVVAGTVSAHRPQDTLVETQAAVCAAPAAAGAACMSAPAAATERVGGLMRPRYSVPPGFEKAACVQQQQTVQVVAGVTSVKSPDSVSWWRRRSEASADDAADSAAGGGGGSGCPTLTHRSTSGGGDAVGMLLGRAARPTDEPRVIAALSTDEVSCQDPMRCLPCVDECPATEDMTLLARQATRPATADAVSHVVRSPEGSGDEGHGYNAGSTAATAVVAVEGHEGAGDEALHGNAGCADAAAAAEHDGEGASDSASFSDEGVQRASSQLSPFAGEFVPKTSSDAPSTTSADALAAAEQPSGAAAEPTGQAQGGDAHCAGTADHGAVATPGVVAHALSANSSPSLAHERAAHCTATNVAIAASSSPAQALSPTSAPFCMPAPSHTSHTQLAAADGSAYGTASDVAAADGTLSQVQRGVFSPVQLVTPDLTSSGASSHSGRDVAASTFSFPEMFEHLVKPQVHAALLEAREGPAPGFWQYDVPPMAAAPPTHRTMYHHYCEPPATAASATMYHQCYDTSSAAPAAPSSVPFCRNLAKGYCFFGERCRFRHDLPPAHPAQHWPAPPPRPPPPPHAPLASLPRVPAPHATLVPPLHASLHAVPAPLPSAPPTSAAHPVRSPVLLGGGATAAAEPSRPPLMQRHSMPPTAPAVVGLPSHLLVRSISQPYAADGEAAAEQPALGIPVGPYWNVTVPDATWQAAQQRLQQVQVLQQHQQLAVRQLPTYPPSPEQQQQQQWDLVSAQLSTYQPSPPQLQQQQQGQRQEVQQHDLAIKQVKHEHARFMRGMEQQERQQQVQQSSAQGAGAVLDQPRQHLLPHVPYEHFIVPPSYNLAVHTAAVTGQNTRAGPSTWESEQSAVAMPAVHAAVHAQLPAVHAQQAHPGAPQVAHATSEAAVAHATPSVARLADRAPPAHCVTAPMVTRHDAATAAAGAATTRAEAAQPPANDFLSSRDKWLRRAEEALVQKAIQESLRHEAFIRDNGATAAAPAPSVEDPDQFPGLHAAAQRDTRRDARTAGRQAAGGPKEACDAFLSNPPNGVGDEQAESPPAPGLSAASSGECDTQQISCAGGSSLRSGVPSSSSCVADGGDNNAPLTAAPPRVRHVPPGILAYLPPPPPPPPPRQPPVQPDMLRTRAPVVHPEEQQGTAAAARHDVSHRVAAAFEASRSAGRRFPPGFACPVGPDFAGSCDWQNAASQLHNDGGSGGSSGAAVHDLAVLACDRAPDFSRPTAFHPGSGGSAFPFAPPPPPPRPPGAHAGGVQNARNQSASVPIQGVREAQHAWPAGGEQNAAGNPALQAWSDHGHECAEGKSQYQPPLKGRPQGSAAFDAQFARPAAPADTRTTIIATASQHLDRCAQRQLVPPPATQHSVYDAGSNMTASPLRSSPPPNSFAGRMAQPLGPGVSPRNVASAAAPAAALLPPYYSQVGVRGVAALPNSMSVCAQSLGAAPVAASNVSSLCALGSASSVAADRCHDHMPGGMGRGLQLPSASAAKVARPSTLGLVGTGLVNEPDGPRQYGRPLLAGPRAAILHAVRLMAQQQRQQLQQQQQQH